LVLAKARQRAIFSLEPRWTPRSLQAVAVLLKAPKDEARHNQEGVVLYKVTPMLTPAGPKEGDGQRKTKDPNAPKEPRKRRKSAVYDGEGHEVLITMMCLKCRNMKPLGMFGLRKMADGAIRNQPWCRTCRSGASTKKRADEAEVEADAGPVVQTASSGQSGTAVDETETAEAVAVPVAGVDSNGAV
jgi:hypothetical protein